MKRWGVVAMFVALMLVNYPMEDFYRSSFPVETVATDRTQALLSVLGGLRAFIAKMLWFKSDVYHHEIESHGVESERDPNIIAMTRFVTLLDPHFIPGYDVGSFDLFKAHQLDDARKFVDEGIRNNPNVGVLYFDKSLYCYKMKLFAEGEEAAIKSLQYTPDPFDKIDCVRMIGLNSAGNHDVPEQIFAYRTWLELRPGDAVPTARLDALLKQHPEQK